MSTLEQLFICGCLIVSLFIGIVIGKTEGFNNAVTDGNFSFKGKFYKVVEVKKVVTYQEIASTAVYSGEK